MNNLLFLLIASACSIQECVLKEPLPLTERIEMIEKSVVFKEAQEVPSLLPPPQPETEPPTLPLQVSLDVPFFAQAPDGYWIPPWDESCEESSITLAHAYLTNQPLSKDEFKETVLNLVDWQMEHFGDYIHTSVGQTAQMLEEFFDFTDYKILENPTLDDLKTELANGSVIIAPFAGQQLGNPFYTGEGPPYHVFILKGYNETHFIAHDVGTQRGENFLYPQETIMSALHDYHVPIEEGDKKVLVMHPPK